MRPQELLAACMLLLVGGTAAAQPRVGPTNRPAVSPYLNLLRPGNSPGVNYYGLVRPQMEFRNNIQNLQQQVTTNQQAIAGLNDAVNTGIPVTGHSTSFLNTGGYFSGGGGRSGGGRPATTATRPASPPSGRR